MWRANSVMRSSCYALVALVLAGGSGCKQSKPGADPAGSTVATGSTVAGEGSDGDGGSDGSAHAAGSGAPGSGAPGSGAAGSAAAGSAATRPAAFAELEAILLPLTREPEGEARSRKTCKQLMPLQTKALAVTRSRPAGVDAAAWQSASRGLMGTLEGLGPICTDDPPDDAEELARMLEHYQRLVALLPAT